MSPLDAFPDPDAWRVTLALAASQLRDFTGLLQAGVAVPIQTGCSVLGFLTDVLGVDPREVQARVTTVFLDGKVVDALDTAMLRDGSSLALSAALPGLVGATLRRSGSYAAMRAAITFSPGEDTPAPAGATGLVHVKLFNLLIDELGPALLAHGVLLDAGAADGALPRWCDEHARPPPGVRVFLRASFGQVVPTCR